MSIFKNLSADKLGCLSDYTNDWDMDDLVEDYCSDLNKSNESNESNKVMKNNKSNKSNKSNRTN